MNRVLPIIVTVLTVLIIGGGGFMLLTVLQPKPEQADEPPAGLSVFAEQVVQDDLVFTVEAQGEVRPQREVAVSPQISGRISYVSPDFIDGGFIRKGQVLVRLEAADYELGVVRAQSGVASAEQRLAREVAEAEIAIQDLKELGIENPSPLARREPQMAEARASLESARAQLADANLALGRTAVVAPFDGRVRSETANIGGFASPGQVLGQIFATDIVEVVLPITDAQLGQLGLPLAFAATDAVKGPEVLFTAQVGGQMREWTGRVTRTSAAINSRTRLINVIAELNDPYGEGADDGAPMAPGLFVTASLQGDRIEDLKVAPRGAIRSGNQIYIGDPSDGELHIYEVDLVYSDPDGAWFHSDEVEIGDLALTSPIQAAFSGMSITVLERMPDGSIKTHEPQRNREAGEGQDTETDETGEALAGTDSAEQASLTSTEGE
ncbi:efflux RND transporter periplasmic adaptor subunit [Hyphomonas sp. FCG-A18]|uniref:efflux RND transporter periplasmic adaptor subunit n=1 Tax=Hyphomonas sp. FCG-A18 TaxID=3080019 RepID=UPI002B2EF301|nr:efflux RND transporter periplasmic adaptor subunit [Hyphomonas sp. FCG-A18]